MSDSSHHEFSIFDAKHFLASTPVNRLDALGLSPSIQAVSSTESRRSVSFVSDAYEFSRCAKALIDAAGATARLRMLSDQQWQIEYAEGDEHWMEIAHYSVLTSPQEMSEMAAELDRVLAWCTEHADAMTIALCGRSDEVLKNDCQEKLRQREDFSRPGGVHLRNDADSMYVLFSVLETIAKLLRRAVASGQWFDYRSQRHEHSW